MILSNDWMANIKNHISWQIPRKANEMSALTLAYIGDAIWEIAVRMRVLQFGDNKPNLLHRKATAYVKADRQAYALHQLIPSLTEQELAVVKRGRNAKSATVPKHASVTDYRHSTAFECLLGYLFITEQMGRLQECMEQAILIIESEDSGKHHS